MDTVSEETPSMSAALKVVSCTVPVSDSCGSYVNRLEAVPALVAPANTAPDGRLLAVSEISSPS